MTGPCADCFKGSIHTGTPTGTVAEIHGLQTYVAYPEAGVTPKGIVVMITDAFGYDFVNNRMLCDVYAKKGGFLVYCPDFMNGMSYPDSRRLALVYYGPLSIILISFEELFD